jgi:CheY-like chemotaxis protein
MVGAADANCFFPRRAHGTIATMPEHLRGVRVVLVEDHDDSRELLALMLEQCGAQVVSAPSARTGLQAVIENRPDVVVSDLGMPGEDGYWLLREVHRQVGALPAVAVTGFSDRFHSVHALEAGFREYLNKPVDPERLCFAVAKALDRRS